MRGSRGPSKLAVSLAMIAAMGSLVLRMLHGSSLAAEPLCEPGFVRGPSFRVRALPVALTEPDPFARAVSIQRLGHSSFLITTPAGTSALTDPHGEQLPGPGPDVVTISNEHPTHNQARAVPGSPRILRGRSPTGEWVEVNVTVGDLSIKSIPGSGGYAPDVPANNTIFAFRAEGLCMVHLGNLRQPLGEEQRRRIGRPDVLMIPIDGQFTLRYDEIALTISQLRPAIVLPMHYDFPQHARLFMDFMQERVPVRAQVESMVRLTRGTLPASSEVLVLGYRE
ncbi:MAG: MBL fold metallo-hydrolase [Candidatus Entotheonellia bacterium]